MNNCQLTRDLIPLYVEGLTNEDSARFVEKHIEECEECQHYLQRIKLDYEEQAMKLPDDRNLDDLISKLAKYQYNIKLISVLTAMFLSYVITGAGVQFLSTIPFIIITPFVCRLFFNRSWPIIISAIPFGALGAMLNEENASYIPFFTVIAFIAAIIGTLTGASFKHANNQLKAIRKVVFIIPAIALMNVCFIGYFSFFGNPIGYVEAMIKTKQYVKQTYEEGTLNYKGVRYNFKDNRHYGQYEYVLNGVRQTASIGFYQDGEVNDDYKYVLDMEFAEERSADLEKVIAAAIDYLPVTIVAHPEEKLAITQDVLNHTYKHLTYDIERQNKATSLRKSESSKFSYEISFGAFVGELDQMTQQEFTDKVNAIQVALAEQSFPFRQIVITAMDEEENTLTSTLRSD